MKKIEKFTYEAIKNKEGDDYMLTALEEHISSVFDEGLKNGVKKGRKEGKETGKIETLKQIVKNMLQFGEKDETIMKYMGIGKEELEKIKGMI